MTKIPCLVDFQTSSSLRVCVDWPVFSKKPQRFKCLLQEIAALHFDACKLLKPVWVFVWRFVFKKTPKKLICHLVVALSMNLCVCAITEYPDDMVALTLFNEPSHFFMSHRSWCVAKKFLNQILNHPSWLLWQTHKYADMYTLLPAHKSSVKPQCDSAAAPWHLNSPALTEALIAAMFVFCSC